MEKQINTSGMITRPSSVNVSSPVSRRSNDGVNRGSFMFSSPSQTSSNASSPKSSPGMRPSTPNSSAPSSPSSSRYSSPRNGSILMATSTASTGRLDPFSKRKKDLADFLKYMARLLRQIHNVDKDDYIRELEDAMHVVGASSGCDSPRAEDGTMAEYFNQIQAHDPDRLRTLIEDLVSLILVNPSAVERDNKQEHLLHAYNNLKTVTQRRDLNSKLVSSTASDSAKFDSMRQLFEINYFSSNTFYEHAHSSLGDRLSTTAQAMLARQAKEAKELSEQRQRERSRARTARLVLNKQREESLRVSSTK